MGTLLVLESEPEDHATRHVLLESCLMQVVAFPFQLSIVSWRERQMEVVRQLVAVIPPRRTGDLSVRLVVDDSLCHGRLPVTTTPDRSRQKQEW